jgi:hypothetical protein
MSKAFFLSGGVALVGCVVGYNYVTDEVMKSSSLVQQTIFSLNFAAAQGTGPGPVKISSSVRGNMNQFKGHANITFDVTARNGDQFTATVKAHRVFLNWVTDELKLIPKVLLQK